MFHQDTLREINNHCNIMSLLMTCREYSLQINKYLEDFIRDNRTSVMIGKLRKYGKYNPIRAKYLFSFMMKDITPESGYSLLISGGCELLEINSSYEDTLHQIKNYVHDLLYSGKKSDNLSESLTRRILERNIFMTLILILGTHRNTDKILYCRIIGIYTDVISYIINMNLSVPDFLVEEVLSEKEKQRSIGHHQLITDLIGSYEKILYSELIRNLYKNRKNLFFKLGYDKKHWKELDYYNDFALYERAKSDPNFNPKYALEVTKCHNIMKDLVEFFNVELPVKFNVLTLTMIEYIAKNAKLSLIYSELASKWVLHICSSRLEECETLLTYFEFKKVNMGNKFQKRWLSRNSSPTLKKMLIDEYDIKF